MDPDIDAMWRIRILFNQPVIKLSLSDVIVDGGELKNIVSHAHGAFEATGTLNSTAKMISAYVQPPRDQPCSSGFESNTLTARLQSGANFQMECLPIGI